MRNIQPRPSVGFKFHAVLVVNSVYRAGLSAADADRWLALFWAIDYFKDSQARNVQEGDWRMKPVGESSPPEVPKTQQAFRQAMDTWDEAAADTAVVRLARTTGSDQVFELLYLTSGDDQTRRLLLLQAAAFLPMFRQAMEGRGHLREMAIDRLEPLRSPDNAETCFVTIAESRRGLAQPP